ncbi:MAG: nuclear transport factor 2 family protein [Acidobacteria bacterium]|nr:nuclear transport factor 2 family protein [Acidobacteriota bacterium]MBV9478924.1 nuclear transport factor 2 family protein [Acidobacteriota bacterium]
MQRPFVLAVVALALVALSLACASTPAATPAAPSADLDITSTVLATYNVMSGPAGRRDWDRYQDLFAPGAHIIAVKPDGRDVVTPEEFVTKWKPYYEQNALFEHPVATQVQRAGNVAQVLSTFESRHASTDDAPYARGVQSFQLVHQGDRWLIVSIVREVAP